MGTDSSTAGQVENVRRLFLTKKATLRMSRNTVDKRKALSQVL